LAPTLEFWFDFASSYSYPAAMRVEDAALRYGCSVQWRPFLLGPIFNHFASRRNFPVAAYWQRALDARLKTPTGCRILPGEFTPPISARTGTLPNRKYFSNA
jgi:2-hydroxychromene-2-carboxylate isomerase